MDVGNEAKRGRTNSSSASTSEVSSCDERDASETATAAQRSGPTELPPGISAAEFKAMSKNQQKKVLKLHARGGVEGIRNFWKEKKKLAKQRKREQRAVKKKEEQDQWEQLDDEQRSKVQAQAAEKHALRRSAEQRHHELCVARLSPTSSTPILCFDMSFDHMNERDVCSTVVQLKISYSSLRHAGFCMVPHFIGNGSNLQRLLCSSTEWFAKYGAVFDPRAWQEVYTASLSSQQQQQQQEEEEDTATRTALQKKKKKLVYLTADSDNILQSIEPDHIYVVGAFVDHNSKKGLTLSVAQQHNMATVRLPIDETLGLELKNTCKVLTINIVTEVLVRFLERGDWAFALSVLPTRRNNANDDNEKQQNGKDDLDKADNDAAAK